MVDHYRKTKICNFEKFGVCTKGSKCPFAHSAEELTALPDLHRTKVCRTLIRTGACHDPYCTFAHDKWELRSSNAKAIAFKTKPCRFFTQTGRCALGSRCSFAHHPAETRKCTGTPNPQLQRYSQESFPPDAAAVLSESQVSTCSAPVSSMKIPLNLELLPSVLCLEEVRPQGVRDVNVNIESDLADIPDRFPIDGDKFICGPAYLIRGVRLPASKDSPLRQMGTSAREAADNIGLSLAAMMLPDFPAKLSPPLWRSPRGVKTSESSETTLCSLTIVEG